MFCAWDGGRLATEAEWEYTAAGGDENRWYPWGNERPDEGDAKAAYFSCHDGNCFMASPADIAPVGFYEAGNGRWGHADLAGNMAEWVFDWFAVDWYSGAGNTCIDCANTTGSIDRVMRGSGWGGAYLNVRAAYRGSITPYWRQAAEIGIRCGPRLLGPKPRTNCSPSLKAQQKQRFDAIDQKTTWSHIDRLAHVPQRLIEVDCRRS